MLCLWRAFAFDNLDVSVERQIRQLINFAARPFDLHAVHFDRLAQAQATIRTQVYRAEQDANRRLQQTQAEVVKLKRNASAYSNEERVKSQAEASSFLQRLGQYRKISRDNPDALNALWLDEMTRLYARMRENGRIELLDHFLTSEGLNITQFPLLPRKK